MSGNDRTILLVIPVVAALVAFWFLALSPKQDEVKELDARISELQSSVAAQQQAVQQGQQARKDFPRDYQRLVVLGKAVPVDDETASLLVQINRVADRTGIGFQSILQSAGAGSTTAAATAAPAPPTESAASLLPIGATVGSAGLPVLPYELVFRGTYFEIADFMAAIDAFVKPRKHGLVAADGRLVTIDSFSLTADEALPFPALTATMNVTTYVTPADQGLTAGATPAGPSATTLAQETTQAASTTP
jgi:Tfp pilus assembly protein PilO